MSRPRKCSFAKEASERARKSAVAILQVLSGLGTPTAASEALGVSMNRYYQLESRAVMAMLRALEPLPRGKRRTADSELERLRREKEKAEQEAARNLALARTSQKALGLTVLSRGKEEKGRRARRPRVRAKALIEALKKPAEAVIQAEPIGAGAP